MEVEAALNALLGREVEYEPTRLEYVKRAAYIPDFRDGDVLYEAKGRFLSKDRTKLLAIKEAHPGVDIRLVFQRNNKLSKDSTTTYMDWAQQHGFPASVFPDLPVGNVSALCEKSSKPRKASGSRRKAQKPGKDGVPKLRSSSTLRQLRTLSGLGVLMKQTR